MKTWTTYLESRLIDARKAYEDSLKHYDEVTEIYLTAIAPPYAGDGILDDPYFIWASNYLNAVTDSVNFWRKNYEDLLFKKLEYTGKF